MSPRTSGATCLFLAYLANQARRAEAIYILGDFFESWIGDDDCAEPYHAKIIAALKATSDAGVALYFMHGNRDFLLGEAFATAGGARLLSDPYVLSLPNWQFVLSHGDALCTDDTEYMAFRRQVRAPEWQMDFLAKPIAERRAIATYLRTRSEQNQQDKAAYRTDLNPGDTDDFIRQHGYATFIHGHTHQPARHDHMVDGIHVERWVLADWHEDRGEYLAWDGNTLQRQRC